MPHRSECVSRGDRANCGAEDQRLGRVIVTQTDGLRRLLLVCAFCSAHLRSRRAERSRRA